MCTGTKFACCTTIACWQFAEIVLQSKDIGCGTWRRIDWLRTSSYYRESSASSIIASGGSMRWWISLCTTSTTSTSQVSEIVGIDIVSKDENEKPKILVNSQWLWISLGQITASTRTRASCTSRIHWRSSKVQIHFEKSWRDTWDWAAWLRSSSYYWKFTASSIISSQLIGPMRRWIVWTTTRSQTSWTNRTRTNQVSSVADIDANQEKEAKLKI